MSPTIIRPPSVSAMAVVLVRIYVAIQVKAADGPKPLMSSISTRSMMASLVTTIAISKPIMGMSEEVTE